MVDYGTDYITVHIGRTVTVPVSFGRDISGETITSEIRSGRTKSSPLIATWDFSFDTDGLDGEGILTLDDSVTSEITHACGYMDIKEVKDGEPLQPFANPLKVVFVHPITE